LFGICLLAKAQNTVTVEGSHTQDSAGNLLTGTVYFQPTNSIGQPVAYQLGGGGMVSSAQVSTPVIRGAFSITLANVLLTNPSNICFAFSTGDYSGNHIVPNGYQCLQPHYTASGTNDWCQAGVCDLDNFVPQAPNEAEYGVTTINNVSGPFYFTGTGVSCTGTDCTFNVGGSPAFSSITPGTNTLGVLNVGIGSSLTFTPYINSTPGSTPAITTTNGYQVYVLNANAVPTVSGISSGQHVTFEICQPSSGGPYTWTWPASFHGGMTIGTIAGECSRQSFDSASGSTLLSDGPGVINVQP
jgi:hypothetical protein